MSAERLACLALIFAACNHPPSAPAIVSLPIVDAGVPPARAMGKCETPATGPGLDKRAVIAALVPSFDPRTGAIVTEPAEDDAGYGYHFTRDCFGQEPRAGDNPQEAEMSRFTPSVTSVASIDERTFAVWVQLGTGPGYCGAPFGELAIVSVDVGHVKILAAQPDDLECAYAASVRYVPLAGVLVTATASGSEHGGREFERVWRFDGKALRVLGEYATAGSEGRPEDGAITQYEAAVTYEPARIVVRETAHETKCDVTHPELPCKPVRDVVTTRRYAIEDTTLTSE